MRYEMGFQSLTTRIHSGISSTGTKAVDMKTMGKSATNMAPTNTT